METTKITLRDMDPGILRVIQNSRLLKKEFVGNPKKLVELYRTVTGRVFEVHTALDWNEEGEWQPAGYIGYCIL